MEKCICGKPITTQKVDWGIDLWLHTDGSDFTYQCCDCQRPPTHMSNHCPFHNDNPYPPESAEATIA